MPIYFHGISISNVLITHNKKRPWKFWQNAELNGCVRRVEKNNRAILLGRKCCVHLYAWVPIPAKGELPSHSTTTFAPFHYLITHALCSFLICMVISFSLSLSLSLSLNNENGNAHLVSCIDFSFCGYGSMRYWYV